MAEPNPFDWWPRTVTNPRAQIVVERTLEELLDALRAGVSHVQHLMACDPAPAIEDEAALEHLRALYAFFDNGTWNTPEVVAWCVVAKGRPGWGDSVRSGHRTRKDAEDFRDLMIAYYAHRYPHSSSDEFVIERRPCRVTDLKDRPTGYPMAYGRCETCDAGSGEVCRYASGPRAGAKMLRAHVGRPELSGS